MIYVYITVQSHKVQGHERNKVWIIKNKASSANWTYSGFENKDQAQ